MMPSQQCAWISRATQCRLTCITAKVAVGTKIALRPPRTDPGGRCRRTGAVGFPPAA